MKRRRVEREEGEGEAREEKARRSGRRRAPAFRSPGNSASAQTQKQAYDGARRCVAPPAGRLVCLEPDGERQQKTRMTKVLGFKLWATGILLLAATAACAGNNADPPPTTPATTSASTATTTSASPTSPSAQASSDAEAAVRTYYAVLDELGGDPTRSLSKLRTVATSTQLSAMRTVLRQQHARHERQTGSLVIADTKVQSVSLDNSDPSAGKVPAVVIDVCWDVSKVDVLNSKGTSVISPSRPDRGWTRLAVANYKYTADPRGGWRVASGQDLKQAPCAAS